MKHRATASPREQQYIDIQSTYYESLDKEKKKPEGKKAEQKTEAKPAAKTESKKDEEKSADKSEDKEEKECSTDLCAPAEEAEQKAAAEKAAVAKVAAEKAAVEKKAAADKDADLRRRQEQLNKQEAELKKKVDAATKKEAEFARKEADAKKNAADAAKKEVTKNRFLERQKGWEKLVTEFPEDTHARALYVLQLWQDRNTVTIQSYQAVDALLDQVFKLVPNHPAQHYRVRSVG